MAKQDKNRRRVDVSGEAEPLRANPFAALEGLKGGLPAETPGVAPPSHNTEAASAPKGESPSFRVERTRKGGFPVFIEKRPGGKTVTVVRNVTGDAESLLRILKRQCAAGGVIREGAIEIQGDHREKVEALLRESRT